MIILFICMSGIAIEDVLKDFSENSKQFKELNIPKPIVIKFESKIKDEFLSDNEGIKNTDFILTDTILKLSYPKLQKYWIGAFTKLEEQIKEELKSNQNRVIFVNLHAFYYHNETQEYISLINRAKLASLAPI